MRASTVPSTALSHARGPGAVRGEAMQVALAARVQGERTGRSREQGAHGALKGPRAAW